MIGHVVGSYKVTEKIGEGGMGAVFKGIDLMLEREVAIKMLRPELASQPQVVERFRSEAVTLAKLNHPNIATLFSFLRQGEDFFMVMEFVRGQTLENLIRRSGAMTCDRAIALFCQALEGIDHAHRMGIVHRDIKPANMMLTENGTLKVMDFGIARVLGTSRMTKQGNIVGTIEYMSPEQVRGQETDARSDIYSLGILLYEMVTGHVPFYSDSEFDLMRMQIEDAPRPPRMLSANIPHTVEKAIMRALAKKIEARFQSAADFRAALIGDASTPLPAPNPAVMRSADGTQLMGSLGAGPTVPKETRLPEQVAGNPHAGQLKSTRLASDQAPALSYASQSAGPAFQSAQAATGSPPLPPASRSNAKLFIGLAAVLFVIIAGTAVVLLTIAKPQRSQQAVPSSQPVQSTTPSPAPAAGADQPSLTPPAQQPQPMPSQPPQVELGKPAVDSSPRNAVASADTAVQSKSSKAVRKESSAEAAARKEKERKAAEARRLLSQ